MLFQKKGNTTPIQLPFRFHPLLLFKPPLAMPSTSVTLTIHPSKCLSSPPQKSKSMASLEVEKLKFMEKNTNVVWKATQLVQTLLRLLLTSLSLCIFLSSPLWLPAIFSSLKVFSAAILEPKCLFVVCNVIVVVLYGQSKLIASSSSSYSDIYEEYVSMNKSLQRLDISNEDQTKTEVLEEVQGNVRDHEEEEEEGENKGLDELNKRVEDFIAKVNKQRRIEATMTEEDIDIFEEIEDEEYALVHGMEEEEDF